MRTVLVEDLLHELRTGRLRTPSFQRMFVWQREDVIALLDSMFKGYPIGSLIFWERSTERAMERLDAARSEQPARSDAWYVVDGQQRLRSITGALTANPRPPFDVAFDLDAEHFVKARPRDQSLLPLHLILDTAELLEHLRRLPEPRRRARIDAANRVARGLRDYRLPLTIVRGDKAQVEEVFRRLNERGIPLTWIDVQHAMRWRAEDAEAVSKTQVDQSLRHLRHDARRDPLPDPWSWKELAVLESDPALLDQHLRDSRVAPAIPLNVPKGLVGRRPAVVLHPLDRLTYQVLVDARAKTLHARLSTHVFGYHMDSRLRGPRQYVDKVSASRAWRTRQEGWGTEGYSCRTDIASFFASVSLEQIDELLASTDGYAGNSRLLSLLRGWRGRSSRGALPQRCLPSFVLANALLITADKTLDAIPNLQWARWVDDYALYGPELETILEGLRALEDALGELGLRLSAAKTHIGGPGTPVFTDLRLGAASDELKELRELTESEAATFTQLCTEVLAAPWAARVRDVNFLVTRLKRHPELLDRPGWVKAARWMPHAAEHIARLARYDERFRENLESELSEVLEGPWVGQTWAQAKLLGAWPAAPMQTVPRLRELLARALSEQPAMTPTLAHMLAAELPLSEFQELAARSSDWLSHRALWLCAGRAGATRAWLDEQLTRFEAHALLRAAWETRGPALFEDRTVSERGPTDQG
ncbi:GmrSD restriction endonuclease domain-containing protein [Enhygromyxa salina]|uniref:GmrSD restriction endonuclease domain-containing protein n=1 Tax=Enhygromyxa salina TaxID=215803 RepID=UPI0015E5EDAD|nr:DUF262 domain-containing protein [Enhygromyxa salina]